MKKLNRFALLALIGGLLSSALVMGCGGSGDGGDTTEGGAMNSANGATGNASSSNAAQ